jgi:hypothetical protein
MEKYKKETLKKYEQKVRMAELQKRKQQQDIIYKKREIDNIKLQNVQDNNKREKKKRMFKKLEVIEKGNSYCLFLVKISTEIQLSRCSRQTRSVRRY